MIATQPVSPPLKWHGGKHYLADWIISLMPPHVHYVEPFFGGGAVLLRKNPEGVSEVVNDLNQQLTRFWITLSRPDLYKSLRLTLEMTPFSEEHFKNADKYAEAFDRNRGNVGQAIAFFIRARQSRQGLMRDFATLSRNRTRRGMNEQVSSWLSAIEGLPDVHERLKRVVILNRDACDVIKQQDGPNTFFYCDPPYLHETRVTTKDYQHEMKLDDHERLLETLAGIKGKFLLSGYPSHLYDNHAKTHGWNVVRRAIDNKASSKKTKDTKFECLWANYELPATCPNSGPIPVRLGNGESEHNAKGN